MLFDGTDSFTCTSNRDPFQRHMKCIISFCARISEESLWTSDSTMGV
jgi:hypothetical protein